MKALTENNNGASVVIPFLPIKHDVLIDPEWPAVFRSKEFWLDALPDVVPRRFSGHQSSKWTDADCAVLAELLSSGRTVEVAAKAMGIKHSRAEYKVFTSGGRKAFIARWLP